MAHPSGATPVIRTRELLASGRPFTAISTPRKTGELTRVRAGIYIPSAPWNSLTSHERHRILVVESMTSLRSEAVVSDESAAVMWRLPFLGSPADTVQVTGVRTGGQRSTHFVHHRTRQPPPTTRVDGIACTDAARTAIDIARKLDFPSGLMAVDAVLHRGLATVDDFEAQLDQLGAARGTRRARLVLRHADGASESPGESLSRARMIQLAVPLPDLQHEFHDEDGLIGRTDFWWPALGVVGEFDGAGKYGVSEASVAANAVVYHEKLREDRIRARPEVRGFVRWIWSEALTLPRFVPILRRAGFHGVGQPLAPYMYGRRS